MLTVHSGQVRLDPSQTILIVVDDDGYSEAMSSSLDHLGYRTISGWNLEDTWRAPAHQLPDLVIADLRLDGKRGAQLIRSLKQRHELAHCPLLVVSASVSPTHRKRAIAAGADAHLGKPFDLTVLQSTVERLLPST